MTVFLCFVKISFPFLPIYLQNDEQLSKLENEIFLTPGDDTSSYAASQPPSVAGPEWSAENSMDDFPEGSMKEEDSMMDVLDATELDTTSEDYRDFRANLSTPVSAPDQCKISWSFLALNCPFLIRRGGPVW